MAFLRHSLLVVGLTVGAAACNDTGSPADPGPPRRVPLTELGAGTYKGFTGGLYPAGSNVEPGAHAAVGRVRAQGIVPRDTAGTPNAGGKIVLLSIGMSNTTQEFCATSSTTTTGTSRTFGCARPAIATMTAALYGKSKCGMPERASEVRLPVGRNPPASAK